jgi:transposase
VKRQKYSAEFKKEVARLLIIEGQSSAEVSKRLGVESNLLYRWKREHLSELEAVSAPSNGSSPTAIAEVIDRLRKQLAKAERINEILKKTVGYFAKEE